MDNLRDEIADIIYKGHNDNGYYHSGKISDQIINLFKQRVEGLKVIGDEEIDEKLENDWDGLDQPSLIRFVLEYASNKLKEMME